MPKTEKPLSSAKRAVPFEAMRRRHGNAAAEDYTELIADLIARDGEARTCEIAEHLGITHVTALRTIRRLQTEGYLETAPRRPVSLTKKGQALAQYCKERHRLLVEFFTLIGVPNDVAENDVEGIEHHVSDTTLEAIKSFLNANSG